MDQHQQAQIAASGEGEIVNLANDIVRMGVEKAASDIHIEPTETVVKVRFRIDGQFINYKTLTEVLPAR